tara:strand:+ start:627 stop:1055 length:429 start_codon:yes stop_codon:yes gene_type:complete
LAITIPNPNLTKTELSKNDKKIGFKLPLESGTTHGNFESTILTIDAVKEDIISLLKTEKGERVMQPRLGLGLKKNLFENFTPELKLTLQEDIKGTFKLWLPFVNLVDLKINQDDLNPNKVNISVTFFTNNNPNNLESVSVQI